MNIPFRRRLILINTAVLFGTLMTIGGLLVFSTRTLTLRGIDDDLRGRVDRFRRGGPPARPPGGPPPPFSSENPENQNLRGDRPFGQMGGGGMGFGRGPQGNPGFGRGPRGGLLAADDVERPLIFDNSGKLLNGSADQKPLDPSTLSKRPQTPMLTTVTFEERSVRVLTQGVRTPNNGSVFVQFGKPLADYEQLIGVQINILLGFTPIALLIAALTGGFLAERALKPVRRVTLAASQITEADLTERLPVEGQDELGQLALTFNAMMDRLAVSFSQRQELLNQMSKALEEQKRFVADASHELRTPLARIRVATSSSLAQDTEVEDMRDALLIADRAAESMGKLIQQLLLLARAEVALDEQVEFETFKLRRVLEEAVALGRAGTSVEVSLVCEAGLEMTSSAEDISRAVANLVENACRYTLPGTSVFVQATFESRWIHINVVDQGPGIAPEHLPHLTERFYRVDGSRSRKDGGCGLGLAITDVVVKRIGGELSFVSTVGKGTTATISVPRS